MQKLKYYLNKYLSHKALREFSTTLNCFCFIEISVISFFCWQAYELLQWYKDIVTPETFNGVAFWGAMSSLAGAVFGALKYINKTRNNNDK